MKTFSRTLVLIGLITCASTVSFARGDSGHLGSFAIGGFYGLAGVTPGDINNISSSLGSSPAVASMTSDFYYGGTLDFVLSDYLNLKLAYDWHDAKNFTSTNLSPTTGFEVTADIAWGILDYYFYRGKAAYVYFGAGIGLPTYFHVTETSATTVQRNAAFQSCYEGDVGLGFMIASHMSIFFEGGYQQITSGSITDSSGTSLKLANGQNAQVNMSGLRGNAGIKLHF